MRTPGGGGGARLGEADAVEVGAEVGHRGGGAGAEGGVVGEEGVREGVACQQLGAEVQ